MLGNRPVIDVLKVLLSLYNTNYIHDELNVPGTQDCDVLAGVPVVMVTLDTMLSMI